VDGIVETFIKFNPNINRIKFTESGDAEAHETSSTNFDETINLVSPFPNCKVDVASSSCNFFSSPHFSDCSPQGSPQEGPEGPTTFGPNNRAGLSSPLEDIRKPENDKSNQTNVTFSNVLDDQSSLSKDPWRNISERNPNPQFRASSGFGRRINKQTTNCLGSPAEVPSTLWPPHSNFPTVRIISLKKPLLLSPGDDSRL